MITLCCALLRSVLDYGCVVYGSASISMLKKLDLIQALRCITGAIKTTQISAMQVETGESPLDLNYLLLTGSIYKGIIQIIPQNQYSRGVGVGR